MKPTSDTPRNASPDLNSNDCEYEPTPDAQIVAAYYRYVDHGSIPGHDVSDWLETETWLVNERQLNRRAQTQAA